VRDEAIFANPIPVSCSRATFLVRVPISTAASGTRCRTHAAPPHAKRAAKTALDLATSHRAAHMHPRWIIADKRRTAILPGVVPSAAINNASTGTRMPVMMIGAISGYPSQYAAPDERHRHRGAQTRDDPPTQAPESRSRTSVQQAGPRLRLAGAAAFFALELGHPKLEDP